MVSPNRHMNFYYWCPKVWKTPYYREYVGPIVHWVGLMHGHKWTFWRSYVVLPRE
jgi:hypothetical protein